MLEAQVIAIIPNKIHLTSQTLQHFGVLVFDADFEGFHGTILVLNHQHSQSAAYIPALKDGALRYNR
jgi:hypothetical protein